VQQSRNQKRRAVHVHVHDNVYVNGHVYVNVHVDVDVVVDVVVDVDVNVNGSCHAKFFQESKDFQRHQGSWDCPDTMGVLLFAFDFSGLRSWRYDAVR